MTCHLDIAANLITIIKQEILLRIYYYCFLNYTYVSLLPILYFYSKTLCYKELFKIGLVTVKTPWLALRAAVIDCCYSD